MQDISVSFVTELYTKYAEDLRAVREQQRALRAGGMRAQLDDLEAEISYLLLREYRPELVVEMGALHGWSTSWLLSALRDNETGVLHSYDLIDNARREVPEELAKGRWRFTHGDVRKATLPTGIDYLFVDAAHSGTFARWYLAKVMPQLTPGTPVSVHDVFHHSFATPMREGAVVLKWLQENGIDHFTVANARARKAHEVIAAHKRELGLFEPVHTGKHNPMIYFATN